MNKIGREEGKGKKGGDEGEAGEGGEGGEAEKGGEGGEVSELLEDVEAGRGVGLGSVLLDRQYRMRRKMRGS